MGESKCFKFYKGKMKKSDAQKFKKSPSLQRAEPFGMQLRRQVLLFEDSFSEKVNG
jgi:hypothetical protein